MGMYPSWTTTNYILLKQIKIYAIGKVIFITIYTKKKEIRKKKNKKSKFGSEDRKKNKKPQFPKTKQIVNNR